jgi:hypothetical protein
MKERHLGILWIFLKALLYYPFHSWYLYTKNLIVCLVTETPEGHLTLSDSNILAPSLLHFTLVSFGQCMNDLHADTLQPWQYAVKCA